MGILINKIYSLLPFAFCILFSSICHTNKESSSSIQPMEKEKLIISLTISSTFIYYSKRKDFKISVSAINQSNKAYDPDLYLTMLVVNGKESEVWRHAIGNGRRESKWYSLPPGETTSMSWSTMGEQLFPEPGEYILELQLRDIKSESVKVTVLKD